METRGYSSYNAMMFRLSRRFSNNLSFNFNYTRSRIMDLVDNDSDTIINPFNIRQNWVTGGIRSDQRVRPRLRPHAAEGKGSFGQEGSEDGSERMGISGMVRAQSGMPFSVTSNGSTQGVDSGSQYPDVIGDPYAGQNKYRWINPASFQRPLDGHYGNFHRNACACPASATPTPIS